MKLGVLRNLVKNLEASDPAAIALQRFANASFQIRHVRPDEWRRKRKKIPHFLFAPTHFAVSHVWRRRIFTFPPRKAQTKLTENAPPPPPTHTHSTRLLHKAVFGASDTPADLLLSLSESDLNLKRSDPSDRDACADRGCCFEPDRLDLLSVRNEESRSDR